MVGVGAFAENVDGWALMVVSKLEKGGRAEACKMVCAGRTGWEKWGYHCARERVGGMEGAWRLLDKLRT
jgi:hypothetical protein